jgi:hypothetical protein
MPRRCTSAGRVGLVFGADRAHVPDAVHVLFAVATDAAMGR